MNIQSELDRLNFEDWIFIIFIFLSLLNIYGDNLLKKYIITTKKEDERKANEIFLITIIITTLIYLYFLKRNINIYHNADISRKKLLEVKVLGSIFLLIGGILLIYFQAKETNFIGAPSL